MIRVKICGITNLNDALAAISAGADALGFVFYKKSPRFIEPKEVKEICQKLPPFIERVGLFVNCSASFVNDVCKESLLSLAQIHFEANEEFYQELEVKYLRVVRAKTKEDVESFSDEYRIVDAFVESYGGEGKRLNIEWFRDVDRSKIVLAGGLNPENVKEVKDLGFYGVDVSSGVEKERGIKDHDKIYRFIRAVKG